LFTWLPAWPCRESSKDNLSPQPAFVCRAEGALYTLYTFSTAKSIPGSAFRAFVFSVLFVLKTRWLCRVTLHVA
jgi:hypothetical protein